MLDFCLSTITSSLDFLVGVFGSVYSAVGISIFTFIVGAFTVSRVIMMLLGSRSSFSSSINIGGNRGY